MGWTEEPTGMDEGGRERGWKGGVEDYVWFGVTVVSMEEIIADSQHNETPQRLDKGSTDYLGGVDEKSAVESSPVFSQPIDEKFFNSF